MDVAQPPIDEPLEPGAEIGSGAIATVREVIAAGSGGRFAAKVLHARHERDAGARARFEREAKALAALNHPGIVTIYSIEEDAGRRFLTMELIEGDTLNSVDKEKTRSVT